MTVQVRTEGDVLVVTIDRPDVRNAVDRPTAEALADAFARLERDDDLRVGVLTGAGGTFCAGADLHAVEADPGRANRLERSQRAPMGPTRTTSTKPVVAAIEGFAVAGGLELALWADLRVMAEDATLGVFCRRWGVPLIDGGTVRLPRIVGEGRALDLVLTGRAVGAREALDIGLVTRVCEPGAALREALGLAHELSALPQTTLRADRASVLAALDRPVDEALLAEHDGGVAAIEAGGMTEGLERFRAGEGRHGRPLGATPER
jgi:enoyl-CoA hydratase